MLMRQGHRTPPVRTATVCLLILAAASVGQITEVPKDIAPIEAPFAMPQLQRPAFPPRTFDIRDYGARQMGENRDVKITDAVHRAIAAASQNGGGTVLVPPGRWLTGPIHLDRSFMHLGFHIYDVGFQSPDSEAARPMVFTTTMLLIGIVVALNISAMILRSKLRKRFMTGAF